MITLATLPNATPQQVFDQAARHLLTQNAKSMTAPNDALPQVCTYRTPDGLKCAAGCFISDEEFNKIILPKKLNNSSWGTLIDTGVAPRQHDSLIRALQEIHDSQEPKYWASDLRSLAEAWELDITVIREFYARGEA